jgi:hypothetical protein
MRNPIFEQRAMENEFLAFMLSSARSVEEFHGVDKKKLWQEQEEKCSQFAHA